jgi:hypothetical protein
MWSYARATQGYAAFLFSCSAVSAFGRKTWSRARRALSRGSGARDRRATSLARSRKWAASRMLCAYTTSRDPRLSWPFGASAPRSCRPEPFTPRAIRLPRSKPRDGELPNSWGSEWRLPVQVRYVLMRWRSNGTAPKLEHGVSGRAIESVQEFPNSHGQRPGRCERRRR